MTEEPTPPSENSKKANNEANNEGRFNKSEVRQEPTADFWDLEGGEEGDAEPSPKSSDLPVPFAKGGPTMGKEKDQEVGKKVENSALKAEIPQPSKSESFVKTYTPGKKLMELEGDELPRMPGFEPLDGKEEPREKVRQAKPPVAADLKSSGAQAASDKVDAANQKQAAPTVGVGASEPVEAGAQDDGKDKPVDARLKAERMEQGDSSEEFSEKKKSTAGKSDQGNVRSVGFTDLLQWINKLSLVEKSCMVVMIVLVAVFSAIMFLPALVELSKGDAGTASVSFPQQGKHVSVKSAETYWREPVTSGENVDVFRRGTVLLPVVEMKVSGGSAVLRALFLDDEGDSIGDVVTHSVEGESVVTISGTAGFDQSGMHAAYRAGQIGDWSVQISEAANAADDFQLIFEMDLSAQLK